MSQIILELESGIAPLLVRGAAEMLKARRGLVSSHTTSVVAQAGPEPRSPDSLSRAPWTGSKAGAGVRQAGHLTGMSNVRRLRKEHFVAHLRFVPWHMTSVWLK